MTTKDIVPKVMEVGGLDAACRVMHETMRLRVSSSSLRRLDQSFGQR